MHNITVNTDGYAPGYLQRYALHHLMKAIFVAISLCLLIGCSDKSMVGGYHKTNDTSRLLRLSEDGTFLMNSGDTGTYKIEGKKITISDATFGSAEGTIEGNTITFPKSSISETSRNAAGIWKKIGNAS